MTLSKSKSSSTASDATTIRQQQFPFVHETKARVLACNNRVYKIEKKILIVKSNCDVGTLMIALDWPTSTSNTTTKNNNTNDNDVISDNVIQLAWECDDFIFGSESTSTSAAAAEEEEREQVENIDLKKAWKDNDPYLVGLIDLAKNNNTNTNTNNNDSESLITLATLLALNGLESTIRSFTGYKTGKAPLLKNMIAQIQIPAVSEILQQLLLPTTKERNSSLNLRNLLWHGFVGSIPRPWLSLVIILTRILRQEQQQRRLQVVQSKKSKATTKINNNGVGNDNEKIDTQNKNTNNNYNEQEPNVILSLQSIPEMQNLLNLAESWIANDLYWSQYSKIKSWLPSSHHGLWDLVTTWIRQQKPVPVCILAILTILLEHSIRLDWCHVNNRPQDAISRPGSFFVTLDGIGQRDKHNLLLYPTITIINDDDNTIIGNNDNDTTAKEVPNKVIFKLGGGVVALLTDLYASACGGPNIRAALCHGVWDFYLQQELTQSEHITNNNLTHHDDATSTTETFWHMVKIVLVAMEYAALSSSLSSTDCHPLPTQPSSYFPPLQYRPIFSFTAVTNSNLKIAVTSLQKLTSIMQQSSRYQQYYSIAVGEFGSPFAQNLLDDYNKMEMMLENYCNQFDLQLKDAIMRNNNNNKKMDTTTTTTTTIWTAQNVFAEHDTNLNLANFGAARTLLAEVESATMAHIDVLMEAMKELQQNDTATRRERKKWLRVIHSTNLAHEIYTLCCLIAVYSMLYVGTSDASDNNNNIIQQAENTSSCTVADIRKSVKRSRMVLSTVTTFLHGNTDRAIKAAKDYLKGKAIKLVIADMKRH